MSQVKKSEKGEKWQKCPVATDTDTTAAGAIRVSQVAYVDEGIHRAESTDKFTKKKKIGQDLKMGIYRKTSRNLACISGISQLL